MDFFHVIFKHAEGISLEVHGRFTKVALHLRAKHIHCSQGVSLSTVCVFEFPPTIEFVGRTQVSFLHQVEDLLRIQQVAFV